MVRADLRQHEAVTEEFLARGILKGRLKPSFIPITGENNELRRDFGWE